jgi:hypothetical protein
MPGKRAVRAQLSRIQRAVVAGGSMSGRGGLRLLQDQVDPRSAKSLRNSTNLWTRVDGLFRSGRGSSISAQYRSRRWGSRRAPG